MAQQSYVYQDQQTVPVHIEQVVEWFEDFAEKRLHEWSRKGVGREGNDGLYTRFYLNFRPSVEVQTTSFGEVMRTIHEPGRKSWLNYVIPDVMEIRYDYTTNFVFRPLGSRTTAISYLTREEIDPRNQFKYPLRPFGFMKQHFFAPQLPEGKGNAGAEFLREAISKGPVAAPPPPDSPAPYEPWHKAVFRARDLCRQSLEYLVARGLLSPYQLSGRFIKPLPRANAVFRPEHLVLAHYSVADGPLYRDPGGWEQVYRLVRSFFAASAAQMNSQRWKLDRCYGTFGDRDPLKLFRDLLSVFNQCGFRNADVKEPDLTAQLELTESVKVSSLPEPYGKWMQLRQGRPDWDGPVDLKVIARYRVYTELDPPSKQFQTFLDLELSTLAVPVVFALLPGLLDRRKGRSQGQYAAVERRVLELVRQRMAQRPWTRQSGGVRSA